MTAIAAGTRSAVFDRRAFERRVAAQLKNDLDSNGRITPDGIAMIGAEAEFYANRLAIAMAPDRAANGDLPVPQDCQARAQSASHERPQP